MVRKVALVLLIVLLAWPVSGQEEPKWIALLKAIESERQSIEKFLTDTKALLELTQSKLDKIENESGNLRQQLEDYKTLLQERESRLRRQSAELSALKKQLEDKAGSFESLKKNFDAYSRNVQRTIRTQRWIMAGEAVALVTTIILLLMGK